MHRLHYYYIYDVAMEMKVDIHLIKIRHDIISYEPCPIGEYYCCGPSDIFPKTSSTAGGISLIYTSWPWFIYYIYCHSAYAIDHACTHIRRRSLQDLQSTDKSKSNQMLHRLDYRIRTLFFLVFQINTTKLL